MTRVVALVAAIVMIVAALLIRDRIDDGSDSDGTARLVCATELEAACVELDESVGGVEVTIEPAGTTAARLIGLPDSEIADPGFDGWLVPEPWPGIVDSTRQRDQLRPVLAPDSEVLARSPLVIAMFGDREEALRGVCEGPVAWRCLGDVAGTSWDDLGASFPGTVKVAHTNPTVSATGLLVLAQAASEFFGRTDFFLADIETDEFTRWLTRLENSAEPSAAPFDEMLGRYPAAVYDAVGTSEAEAGPALREASRDRRRAFTLLYPDPVATADVVLALAASGDSRDDDIAGLAAGDDALDALAGDGWRVDGEPLAAGLDGDVPLPATANLPSDPGVYVALQGAWSRIAR
jgi:Bacterial extracellular solute-binding protein